MREIPIDHPFLSTLELRREAETLMQTLVGASCRCCYLYRRCDAGCCSWVACARIDVVHGAISSPVRTLLVQLDEMTGSKLTALNLTGMMFVLTNVASKRTQVLAVCVYLRIRFALRLVLLPISHSMRTAAY